MHVYPNPVSNVCNVTFALDQPGNVKLTLTSPMGQTVSTLINMHLLQGKHSFRYNTYALIPGLYQFLLQQGEKISVRKIIQVR